MNALQGLWQGGLSPCKQSPSFLLARGTSHASQGLFAALLLRLAIAHDSVAAQVSRLFSALLQLANNGNIVILRGSNPGQPFQLRLASLEKKHQHFQEYRAPSFLQPRVCVLSVLHLPTMLCGLFSYACSPSQQPRVRAGLPCTATWRSTVPIALTVLRQRSGTS